MTGEPTPPDTARRRRPVRVAGLLYEGAVALDLIGPFEAFNLASLELARTEDTQGPNGYSLRYLASRTGPVTTSIGANICADHVFSDYTDPIDILVVPGQSEGDTRYRDPQLLDWLNQQVTQTPRIMSVCSGAYLLAEAGLLAGRCVTTHWAHSEALQRAHPDVTVQDNKIFCRDGPIYSSGGVTSGVDLALAIIEEDFGRALALKVAKRMVVYLKRQGDQAQYSEILSAQTRTHRFAEAIDWIEANLRLPISLETLADFCAMSPRNFSRQFHRETGMPPMAFVERRRLERAKRVLEESWDPIETVAHASGFKNAVQFRRSFHRCYGVSPSDYRARFGIEESGNCE